MHRRESGTACRLVAVDVGPTTRTINLANWNSRVPHHETGYGARRLPRRSGAPVGGRALRPAAPRRRRRARRRAPAVPHRHRHAVARPPRCADDRARLLRARRSTWPAGWPADARRGRSTTSRASCTTRSTCSAASGSTSCTPASARCAGCPSVAALGRGRRRAVAARRLPVHPRRPPDAVDARRPAPRRAARRRVPVLRDRRARVFVETSTYVEHDGRARPRRRSCSSTTGSARSSTRCWTPACTITLFEEHDSVPWNPLGDAMVDSRRRGVRGCATAASGWPPTYTLRAEKR